MRALLALARPHQWPKNGFVFVGLFFGHGWLDGDLVLDVLLLFAAFCLVSSAVYAFNDVMDREADRAHPGKRARPVASGTVSVSAASIYAFMLAATALLIASTVSRAGLATVAGYMVINLGYSSGLKHVAVLDVFLIAAGFMLRLLAGTSGVGIAPSRWLLLCGLMVTLFFGFAKRRAELVSLREESDSAGIDASQRKSLSAYSVELLDGMIAVTAAGTVLGYAFYTIDPRTIEIQATADLVFTVPFVVYGVARYLWVLYRRGGGADPSTELLKDAHLVVSLAGWFALTAWLIA
jgi:4-hydroxybenzoate polyprenyltransferase